MQIDTRCTHVPSFAVVVHNHNNDIFNGIAESPMNLPIREASELPKEIIIRILGDEY